MLIKLKTHYLGHASGEVIEINEGFARPLIQQGRAEPYYKEVRKAPKDKMVRKNNTK